MNFFKKLQINRYCYVLIIIVLVALTIGAIAGYFWLAPQQKENSSFAGALETKNNQNDLTEEVKGTTILFVGDIMLDRGVEYLMKKNGVSYPFLKISQFLKGFDIVFGNLEGPIVKEPQNFSDGSLKFAFSSEVIEGLLFGNFNLLSLANNHTLNMGNRGLQETRNLLKENNVHFVGDTVSCSQDLSFAFAPNLVRGFADRNIQFLAFNKTFSFSCKDEEIIRAIESIKAGEPNSFLTVSLHWGEEYQLLSVSSQQELAHKIIDAGADLIIGHHPHVVQEIEAYQGKLIFYSLGNFIFDQYFSQETQEGLAVEVEIYPHTNNIGVGVYPEKTVFRLFPIQSRLSQPYLMEREETEKFLDVLSKKSDKLLTTQITNGIIEMF